MTRKALGQLQEEHSVLCARAADMGISVPDDLTIDFDSAEVGSTVVANLEALIRNEEARLSVDNPNSEVAEAADEELSTASKPKKKRSKAKQVEDVQPVEEESATMANARKKQPVAKKAKKSKKADTARRAPASKAKRNSARGTNSGKSQKIIEMMKKSGGVTREQVLKMTGWKAVSMQQLAKTAGVKLKVEKSERPFRYSI